MTIQIRMAPTKSLLSELLSDLVDAATDYGMAVGTTISDRDLDKEDRASSALNSTLGKIENAIKALNIPE